VRIARSHGGYVAGSDTNVDRVGNRTRTTGRHDLRDRSDRFGDAFVFSGDSEAFAGLANFADGAAVLAHDCSFPDDVDVSNHPTPSQLGEALAGAEIGRVYLTHFYPHAEGNHEEMIEAVRRGYDGDVRIASDLTTLRIE
jgi:ribonuclease BN (tRNA processing enzyme)